MRKDLYSYIETDSHWYFDQVDCEVIKWIPLWIAKIIIRIKYHSYF